MKIRFTFFFLLFSAVSFAQSIEVNDVKQQGNSLQVFYNFSGGSGLYTVSLYYSLDNGSTWLGPARAVSGDVGKGIKPGSNKSILWNVLADREHLKGEALRFKVFARSEIKIEKPDLVNTNQLECKDFDGNIYHTVQIGNQLWMKENLKTTRYLNGDTIDLNLNKSLWENTSLGACAVYEKEAKNDSTYGKLYNWFAVVDPRSICPVGWHIPNDDEWTNLESYLGGRDVAGGKLKAISNLWKATNNSSSNESDFSGIPGGYRKSIGYHNKIGTIGYWWSSSEFSSAYAWLRYLNCRNGKSYRYYGQKHAGFSVRCLRD